MSNQTTQASTREAVEAIVLISQRIDELAQTQDWTSMNDLVEERMGRLTDLFDVVRLSGPEALSAQDREKLSAVATANQQILESAKLRRGAVVKDAVGQRIRASATKAYANFNSQ